jgi:hypothetical protein
MSIHRVRDFTIQAYSDCNPWGSPTSRCLDFKADGTVSVEVWTDIMNESLHPDKEYQGQYNAFHATSVGEFLTEFEFLAKCDLQIRSAREGSVACYISERNNHADVLNRLYELCKNSSLADECGFQPSGELRLWWD